MGERDIYESRALGIESREKSIKRWINKAGIKDKRVKRAMFEVPREEFVLPEDRHLAYADKIFPIGERQTISQPSLVAQMTEALRLEGKERVLEIGTGSGYQTAILSLLAGEVYTIERIEKLSEKAKLTLERLGFDNINFYIGDGSLGLPDEAPFDAVMVTAGLRKIPPPLYHQLETGGRMVAPIGESPLNLKLILGIKHDGYLEAQQMGLVRFVPLVGKYGWAE